MKQTARRHIAFFLVVVQLFVLCPFLVPAAKAAETDPETPALNKTIVGTVKFQSFNFLGDNDKGSDGVDYSSTFYYTDDYFARSAINENATKRVETWTALEDPSMAACSIDFAVAAMTSAKGDVVSVSDQPWDNSDYTSIIQEDGYTGNIKERNVRMFLSACGFDKIECTELDKRPTNDSIGYTIGSKEITVWNVDTQKNETYTLIAVGVRGAGYGQEWASNVTIGDYHTNQMASNGRHYGFDSSAQTVCSAIDTYLRTHAITGSVKYWVTGFSRAAAVANLVAGYLTDNGSQYLTKPRDVYGYTWECPQAAKKTSSPDTNFTNYKNIHNILNPMDAVPKVSPDAFEHQRLGVDYQMPYHGNVASTTQNTTLYNQMYSVLKTIAVGNGSKEDPLIETVNPINYPYNKVMTIYKMSVTQLLSDAASGNLMTNFGAERAEHKHGGIFGIAQSGNVEKLLGWDGKNDYKTTTWYLDDFIDSLVKIFLTSNAWVGQYGATRSALANRTTFINDYQEDFRTLFGYFLDYSGPAFLGMIDILVEKVEAQLKLSNAKFAIDLGAFYLSPKSNYLKNNLISSAKPVAKDVADDMTSDFTDPQGITRDQMHNALDHLVSLVVNLYAYELSEFDSQYLGTTLKYLWTILCTHEQETVMSWIKSLDSNHINRGYRTLTVPKGTDVKMYLCRSGYGEALGFDTDAPLVAEAKNCAFVPIADPSGTQQQTLDDRISVTESGSNMVIRYPSLLDLRFDVTTDTKITDLNFSLSDYRTNAMATALSDGEKQYDPAQFTSSNYTCFTSSGANTWNTLSSSNSIPLDTNETLSITARHTASYNENDTSSNLFYNMRKHGDTTRVIDFNNVTTVASDAQTLSDQTSINGQFQRKTDKTVTYQLSAAAQSGSSRQLSREFTEADTASVTHTSIGILTHDEALTVVPASSIYYDDDLAGQTFTSDGHGYSSDIDDDAVSKSASAVSGTVYYTFYGSGIDVYCTTDNESGYVSAAVFRGSGADACVRNNRVGTAKTVSNNSANGTRYNTPTISFMNLEGGADTYTLKITALTGANFKLDGVRVYHPVQANSAAEAAQIEAGEGNVLYLNLHDMLVNGSSDFTVDPPSGLDDDYNQSTISGVLYVDNASAIVAESHYDENGEWHEEMTKLYANQFDAYKKNSPNNEIYLAAANGDVKQAITFRVDTTKAAPGSTIYVGMSAPETGSGSGTVSVTGNGSKNVTSVMDMYYGITVPTGGSITITNTGESLISLTNLKIPNVADAKSIDALSAPERKLSMRAFFLPVTTETVELAAAETEEVVIPEDPVIPEETAAPEETPAPTPAPTPTPTPVPAPTPTPTSSMQDAISRLLSSFVSSLFGSISRLFG